MNHIANVGPLAVSVDASIWHSYDSGVFDGCSYDENIEINHAVQVCIATKLGCVLYEIYVKL